MQTITRTTPCGALQGLELEDHLEYRGIRYATAERWEYPRPVKHWEGVYDATHFGACCCQHRGFDEDTKVNPFYSKEFRVGCHFTYSEDCQYLNIWAPKDAKDCPVLIYIHGGSFTGGSTDERHISGTAYAKKGVIFVAMNYRLGPYGFCAHPQLKEADGTCGNYGLYDQLEAIRWVRRNIAALGGDPHRVTLLGQSAGAMSVDILISSPLCRDWYQGAVMMSGPGLQRAAARPQSIEKVGKFWDQICKNAGAADMAALRQTDARTLYYAWLDACKSDKLSMLYTFPVFDGKLLTKDTFNMRTIPKMPKILGMTNADMIPAIVSGLIRRWVHDDKGSPCYAYCFDRDLPGDSYGAWHSADLLYAFGTLQNNWRPFTDTDREISRQMVAAFANFAKCGNPNCNALPRWKAGTAKVMRFGNPSRMAPFPDGRLIKETLHNKGPV